MRSPGRPKDEAIDHALAGAITDIIHEGDTAEVTVRRLASRAGVTRDAFYRRFTGLGHFLITIAVARYEVGFAPDTGDLGEDLHRIQLEQIAMFSDPVSKRFLAVLMHAVASDPTAARAFDEKFLAPRRVAFLAVLDRAVARGEIPPVADPDAALAMTAGPMFFRALLPATGELDDAFARSSADALHAMLRAGAC